MDPFVAAHKSKHLLSHVLAAAGSRMWRHATFGDSGESATGFYADFGGITLPTTQDLEILTSEMLRILENVRVFRDVTFSAGEATKRFAGHPWKQKQIAILEELDGRIRGFELDEFVDLCECVLKSPNELRRIHPEHFFLVGADWVCWQERNTQHRLVRITGELFPTPPPCECCLG